MTGLLLAASLLAGVNMVRERPTVEYAEAEDGGCLKQRPLREIVTLEDLRAAEIRWLDENYPGRPVRWQIWMTFPPRSWEFGPGPVTIHTDTASVQLPDGTLRRICFEINRVAD